LGQVYSSAPSFFRGRPCRPRFVPLSSAGPACRRQRGPTQ